MPMTTVSCYRPRAVRRLHLWEGGGGAVPVPAVETVLAPTGTQTRTKMSARRLNGGASTRTGRPRWTLPVGLPRRPFGVGGVDECASREKRRWGEWGKWAGTNAECELGAECEGCDARGGGRGLGREMGVRLVREGYSPPNQPTHRMIA